MRILIDTNILISEILGNGTPFQAYVKAVSYPNSGVVCTQNIDELRRIFNRKFPKKISAMEQFLAMALSVIEVVQVPDELTEEETSIRDVNDRGIMRAAVASRVDVILTGDKDFLESGLSIPKIMTAADFLMMENNNSV